MTAVQAPRRRQRLVKRTKDDREHRIEGSMKSADGIGERLRMVQYCLGHPRMRQLQQ
jgi:hypothetical protein